MTYEELFQNDKPWSELTVDEVAKGLQVDTKTGLTTNEVITRFEVTGPNELPSAPRDSWIKLFFRQFQSALIYLLLFSSIIVVFLGDYVDAAVIMAVLLFNAIIGMVQEGRAEATLDSLKKITPQQSAVIRDGQEIIVEEHELVPGDLIILKEGERVPADIRLIQAARLRVDEAALTGESVPVHKDPEHMSDENAPFGDRLGMAFKGTYVVGGHGEGLVVATGTKTELGKISQAIASLDAEMPLKKEMRKFSLYAVAAVAIVSFIVFLQGLRSGQDAFTMLKVIISLAVSIIPEGLPVVMTLVLATGVWRMAKKNAVVKRLQAVEALGQTDIIAVDKTGTITRNELVVRKLFIGNRWYEFGGKGYEPVGEIKSEEQAIEPLSHDDVVLAAKISAFSSSAHMYHVKDEKGNVEWKIGGDPTEAALLVMAAKIGFKQESLAKESPRLDEIPFSHDDRIHASLHRIDEERFVAVSGAPEAILPKSTHQLIDGKVKKLDHHQKLKLQEIFRELSRDGLRVLALAHKEGAITEKNNLLTDDDRQNYVFSGFCALEDSPRTEVAAAITEAQEAGIKVVMITGDHALTATAIAAKVGLVPKDLSDEERDELVLTGEEIDRLSDKSLAEKLEGKSVFARVTPLHKLRLITAFKENKKVIAMTGDGVNDAPSLVAADLGVSMGKIGTDVAKESADIILLDDNFGTILDAGKEGRNIYQTIKKVILYLFSTSVGETLTIGGALFIGTAHLPLLPAQILWLNLVTDGFLTTALAVEPREGTSLKDLPRKSSLIDRLMLTRIPFMAIPMMIGTLFVFYEYAPHDITKAWAMTLTTLSVFQWFNVWNCRSATKSIFRMNWFSNPWLIWATIVVVALQFIALYVPFFQTVLRTAPLSLEDWGIAILLSSTIFISEEFRKLIARHFAR